MESNNGSIKTVCRQCGKNIQPSGEEEKYVSHCNMFHVVGNSKNIKKLDNRNIYKEQKISKIIKNKKGGNMEETKKKGWQKKTILENLADGKSVEDISTEFGIRLTRVKRVKKKFYDTD